ncbi:uncharacterized protein LOC122512803 [Leptopilina heterotoma]|uniref:uncharacterized protein LOC122512803 n=1 Tax=Leptopilina heterotoma TaxID=63436 RepID=UPI001CAA10E6|nr:uncharacterized protein LOC122512803 [Leptopilina heterotoma]
MQESKKYKTCFVPQCISTTFKTPEKLFFFVPQTENVRKHWFQIARRNDTPSIKSKFYCCQDHFNLKEDMDNYVRFCLMGAPKKLKQGITPHKFDCQPNRVKTWIQSSRSALEKLTRKREISEILSSSEKENLKLSSEEQILNKRRKTNTILADLSNCNDLPSQPIKDFLQDSSHVEIKTQQKLMEPYQPEDSTSPSVQNFSKQSRDFGVQVQQNLVKPHVRSKSILCKPENNSISIMCKPDVADATVQCDLITGNKVKIQTQDFSDNTSSGLLSCSTNPLSTNPSSGYKLPSSLSATQTSSVCSDDKKQKNKVMKETALKVTKYFISMDSKKYTGITNDWMWIVNLLESTTGCPSDNILLTLMKIKTNDTFSRLGDRFGLLTSQTSKIFRKTVKPLAHYLKTLVFCPNPTLIKKNLPIPFRASYNQVCIIVDAFEIEIEKPSDPIQQSLTWSDYKKCNTLKYLIGCTPDGFVSFMSPGYGGRTSDIEIFKESGIMDIIPEKCGVMADRGFKQIQTILNTKKCKLVRPPSVSASVKSSKSDVLKTKSVASLRIHVERVIRRVREYKMLSPHACLDWNLIPYVDDISKTAAGLINFQKPIIKK